MLRSFFAFSKSIKPTRALVQGIQPQKCAVKMGRMFSQQDSLKDYEALTEEEINNIFKEVCKFGTQLRLLLTPHSGEELYEGGRV